MQRVVYGTLDAVYWNVCLVDVTRLSVQNYIHYKPTKDLPNSPGIFWACANINMNVK